MTNYGKIMQIVSIVLLVASIIYSLGAVLIFLGGLLMVAASGTQDFVTQLVEAMDRVNVTPEMLSEAVSQWNGRFGTNLSVMQMIRAFAFLILLLGIAMIAYSVLGIVCACLGFKVVRGEKAGVAFVLGIILLVFTLVRFVFNAGLGLKLIIKIIVYFVPPALYVYAAKGIKDQSEGRV